LRISTPEERSAMAGNCANRWCSAPRLEDEGKLFRLDINLGNRAGGDERKTEYIWLCASCANRMHPKVEVSGNTVTLRLTKNEPRLQVTHPARPLKRAN
jgi:hypothetical protein